MKLIPNFNLPLEVVYEDAGLLIANKPAGVPVYPLKSDEKMTIANALAAHDPKLDDVGPPLQAGLIHRLDNTTSGLLVVARTSEIYEKLKKEWNTTKVTKVYTALVIGKAPDRKIITTGIAHHPRKKKKMMPCEASEKMKKLKGREALSELKRIKTYSKGGESYSLVSVKIKTGVRHQIRVHLASIGHPIVGDALYQNPRQKKRDPNLLHRPFLHLERVSFNHPVTGKKLDLHSPLPTELASLLNKN